jgi:hypothetical protein
VARYCSFNSFLRVRGFTATSIPHVARCREIEKGIFAYEPTGDREIDELTLECLKPNPSERSSAVRVKQALSAMLAPREVKQGKAASTSMPPALRSNPRCRLSFSGFLRLESGSPRVPPRHLRALREGVEPVGRDRSTSSTLNARYKIHPLKASS